MSSFPKGLSLLFAAAVIFFSSCSSENPEASSVDHRLIYDFKDEESFPDTRLSVFLSLESKAQKASSIKLIHEETNLQWTCNTRSMDKVEHKNSKWVGCTNFFPVKNEDFPSGQYSVIYEDLEEKETETYFNLQTAEDIKDHKAGDFPAAFTSPNTKKIAVYSNEDVLLYFGEEKEEWDSNEKIIYDFKNAWCLRTVYVLKNGTVYCLMPPVLLGNTEYIKETSDSSSENNK